MDKTIFSQSKFINNFLNEKTKEIESKIETPQCQNIIENFLDKKSIEYDSLNLSKDDYDKFILKDMIYITTELITKEFNSEKELFYKKITSKNDSVIAEIKISDFLNLYVDKIFSKLSNQYIFNSSIEDIKKIKKLIIKNSSLKFKSILNQSIVIEQKIITTDNEKYLLLYNKNIINPLPEQVVEYFKNDYFFIKSIKENIINSVIWNERKGGSIVDEKDDIILTSIIGFSQKEILKFYYQSNKTMEFKKVLYNKLFNKKINLFKNKDEFLKNNTMNELEYKKYIDNNLLNINALKDFDKKITKLIGIS